MAATTNGRALLDEGLSGPWLAARLGVPSSRLDRMRRAGELLGVRAAGRWDYVYPAWQFGGDGQPLASIPRVLRTARAAGLGDAQLYEVLTRRVGLLGDGTVADVLRDGNEEYVVAVVRQAANGSMR